VQHFYHEGSGTLSYVVSDPATSCAAIIDPVLGFSVVSGRTDTAAADAIVAFIRERQLSVQWILETHAHADHLSSAQYLKAALGGEIGIGEGIRKVQQHFGPIFNLKPPFAADGHQFDRLFKDGDTLQIGKLEGRVLHTPGHTSDSVTYVIGNYAFVGDTLFMVDAGTARCDFPGGDAGTLYDSIQRLLSLPADTLLCLCHDYPPESRGVCSEVTVAEQRERNIHVGGGTARPDFVEIRTARDRTLSLPALIVPSIQVNICAGHLPSVDSNDIAYIRIPLDTL
jgi:glyoxylase-like metal-dependent hydrolase (beta-lactamase superfamily II)